MRLQNRLWISISAFFIAAALVSACSSSAAPTPSANSNAPTNSASAPVAAAPTVAPTVAPTSTVAPTPSVAPTTANPQELLSKALSALNSVKTLRLTVNSTTSGKSGTVVFDYVSPGAFHVTQPDGTEDIVIKDKGAYEKKGSKWSKLPLPVTTLNTIITTINPVAIIDKERQKLDEKSTPQVGADIVGGRPMVTYQYNNPQGHQGYVKLWYGVTDGLLYKFDGSDQTGKATGTIEYNVPITIVAPIS
jgi:hypothetical protein